eukprot:Lithocolla_globosa_v1_NODE_4677_length_1388_cov_1435.306827.p1 type:complete len:383 gc:universal NODE_4677_length_1388_cov_1435.306827:224-1372(+)
MIVQLHDKKFKVPEDKLRKFIELLEYILAQSHVDIKTLQRLLGKAVSFGIAVPNSILFCREGFSLITKAEQQGNQTVEITEILKEELSQFHTLKKDWNGSSWRKPGHTSIKIYTDAAGLRWMGHAISQDGTIICGAELGPNFRNKHIDEKEAEALFKTLLSLDENILRDRWVEIVDNQVLFYNFNNGGSKSPFIRKILKDLFHLQKRLNFGIIMKWVGTKDNPADEGTRYPEFEDLSLATHLWNKVELWHGPHTIDHMASHLTCKVKSGIFFSRFAVPGTAGVNVFCQKLCKNEKENAYCFPPPMMVGAYIEHAMSQKITVTLIVIREKYELWWPICMIKASSISRLARRDDESALISASGKTYPLKGDMFAIRLRFDSDSI